MPTHARKPSSQRRPVSVGTQNLARREFLRRGAALSLTGAAMPLALNLATAGAAAAATATDYKALVCVFLYGGNDHFNTVVPYDTTGYNAYQSARSSIALARASLLPLAGTAGLPSGQQMALAPSLPGLQTLYAAGRMGVLLNVGPLVVPTTQAQYNARSVPLPPKLFSHNDQQSVWQSLVPEGATSGWGGRISDLFLSSNANATFTCVNVSGNAVFMAGREVSQYVVGANGAVALNASTGPVYGSQAVADALRLLTSANRSHLFEAEHTRVMQRATQAQATLVTALPAGSTFSTVFDTTNGLAMQLQMVARMIAARSALGAKRQVFFVSIGGFDHHDFLLDQQPGLLAAVDGAMKSFYDATVELGVGSAVTTFTASDFGRTLTSNGDGSDHGWGSHHMVVGGAVNGGRFWGTAPVVSTTSADQVGQGRLLPSTSVDQLGETLARWFGVPGTEMALAFPNIGNFNTGTLPLFA